MINEIIDNEDNKINEETTQEIENLNQKNEECVQKTENDVLVSEENLENSDEELEKSRIQELKTGDNNIKIADEIVNSKIEEAMKKQSPKNRRKSTIISVILLCVNLFFMFFIVKNLFAEIDGDIFYALKTQGHKLWWLFAGVIAYVVFIIIQVLEYKLLIQNLSDLRGKRAWKSAYDVTILGRYYDNLTPLSVGGEPMQIVSLAKEKVSPAVATGIPVIKMLVNTVISALLAVVFFVFGLPHLVETTALNKLLVFLLELLGIIGVVVTACSALFMFFLSTGTLFTRSFISSILRFLYKIKIVKNYRKTYKKVLNQVSEYKFSMKYLMSHKPVFFKLFFMCLLDNIIYSIFPCFVILAFSNNLSVSPFYFVFICMIKYHLSAMASCFIPLPGGTGMMEISFIILFGNTVGQSIVWALLAWRFLSYYLILIHGFVHELSKIIKNFIKHKKESQLESLNEDIVTDSGDVANSSDFINSRDVADSRDVAGN